MKIKATVWQTGSGSAVITIPRTHIESGNIKIGEEITIEVIENEKEENKSDDE